SVAQSAWPGIINAAIRTNVASVQPQGANSFQISAVTSAGSGLHAGARLRRLSCLCPRNVVCNILKTRAMCLLTKHYKLQYKYSDLRYDTRRKNPLPARGGRLPAGFGTTHDAAGNCAGGQERTGEEHQPVVLVAD